MQRDPNEFIRTAEVTDFKLFWYWVMNTYNRIVAAGSIDNYSRVMRMHLVDSYGRTFDKVDRRDLRNV